MTAMSQDNLQAWNPQGAVPPGVRLTNYRKAGGNSIALSSSPAAMPLVVTISCIVILLVAAIAGLPAASLAWLAAFAVLLAVLAFGLKNTSWRLAIAPDGLRTWTSTGFLTAPRERVVSLADVESVYIGQAGNGKGAIIVATKSGHVPVAEGSPDDTLMWVKNYLIMEIAGLTWRPIGSREGKEKSNTLLSPPNPVMLEPELTARLIDLYISNAPSQRLKLTNAVASKSPVAIRAAAHWLKSASASVGAHHLSEIYQLIEISTKTGQEPELQLLLRQSEKKVAGLEAWLRDLSRTSSGFDQSDQFKERSSTSATAASRHLIDATVLVVDDSPLSREVASQYFSQIVQRVKFANDGAEAVDAWRANHFDAIFMDCEMSGMNGFDATRAIRKEEQKLGRVRVPIIALTGHVLIDYKHQCLAAGMDDYLQKPYRLKELKPVVARWLGPSRQQL